MPAGLTSPTPPPLAPLTLSVGQVRPSTLLVTRPTVPDNADDYTPWPAGNLERPNDGLQQSASGPVIRCLSARSSPVAQLRFFVNNQPVSLSRTLENSTTSYSDGTESNMVSFRLTLPDFTLTDDNNNSLDRAASLKSNSSQSDSVLKQSQASTTTTTTTTTTSTTTTTTSTTARPNSKDKSKNGRPGYANENVQFDDHNAPMRANDFKIAAAKAAKPAAADKRDKTAANANKETANKQGNQKKRKLKKPNTTDEEQKRPPAAGATRASLDRDLERATNADRNQVDEDEDEEESVVSPLPADPDKAERKRELAESSIDLAAKSALANYSAASVRRKRTASATSLVDPGNYKLAGPAGLSEAESQKDDDRVDASGEQARPQHRRPTSGAAAPPSADPASRTGDSGRQVSVKGEPNQGRLARQEQRVRATAGNRDDTNEGQAEQLYSNYIRIKCTSLVPAVGYEMTSELSVPLTVLVPARQISDAFRQSQLAAGQSPGTTSARQRDDTSSRRSEQQRQRRPSGHNEAFFGPSRFAGNSLQAPRAVLIDRLAQASGPAGKTSVRAEPAPSTSTPNQGQSPVKSAAAPVLRTRSNSTASQDRARYLEELTRKRDKAGEYQSTG